jgi:hypothetical protein
MKQRYPGQDFATVKNELEMMEMLSACCTTAHQYCKQVLVKCRVAQVLFLYFFCSFFNVSFLQAIGLTYNQVRGKSEYEILEHLVRKGKDTFRLARSFIQVCHLDSSKVTDPRLPRLNLISFANTILARLLLCSETCISVP